MKKSKKPVVNTKTIGINMNKALAYEIEKRSKAMNVSVSLYCKHILGTHIHGNETK